MGQRGLNNKDLKLGLKINGDLRLNNRGVTKKSGSPGASSLGGVVAPTASLWIRPGRNGSNQTQQKFSSFFSLQVIPANQRYKGRHDSIPI